MSGRWEREQDRQSARTSDARRKTGGRGVCASSAASREPSLTVQPKPCSVKSAEAGHRPSLHHAHASTPKHWTSQHCGKQTPCREVQKTSRHHEPALGAPLPRRILVLPKRERHCPPSIDDYRRGYPSLKDDSRLNANYMFYTGRAPFQPRGSTIDAILNNWKGKYDILESRHDYIQWLFPTRDGSKFNYHAQPLQKHEIKAICTDRAASDRVLRSYVMMLDFFGMKLNPKTGEVERSEHYTERFAVLNASSHNYMRITCILKSLGELDYEYLKPPFVRFVISEALQSHLLDNTLNSCMKYWVETIRDENERDSFWLLAHKLFERYV